jgi:hypothetical protein
VAGIPEYKVCAVRAVLVRRDAPDAQTAAQALEATFGVPPVFVLGGGCVMVKVGWTVGTTAIRL